MTKRPKEANRLRKIVDAFPKVTVTVLGDLVADEFIFGEISRVSREAPVLILKHRERTVLPGGGANAVNNLADLGVNVLPVGVVGGAGQRRLLNTSVLLLGAVPQIAATMAATFTIGFAFGAVIVPAGTLIQRETPHDMLGRVGSTNASVIFLGQILGLAISGIPPFAGFYSKDVILEAA